MENVEKRLLNVTAYHAGDAYQFNSKEDVEAWLQTCGFKWEYIDIYVEGPGILGQQQAEINDDGTICYCAG